MFVKNPDRYREIIICINIEIYILEDKMARNDGRDDWCQSQKKYTSLVTFGDSFSLRRSL